MLDLSLHLHSPALPNYSLSRNRSQSRQPARRELSPSVFSKRISSSPAQFLCRPTPRRAQQSRGPRPHSSVPAPESPRTHPFSEGAASPCLARAPHRPPTSAPPSSPPSHD